MDARGRGARMLITVEEAEERDVEEDAEVGRVVVGKVLVEGRG